jgi:alkylation response protein AidB-like acyl-CoA dehydrogenase
MQIHEHRAEVEDLMAAVREFCAQECGTREQRAALTEDGAHQHNVDLYRRMAALGWVTAGLPEEYGGGGLGWVTQCMFLEETQRAMAPIGGVGVTLVVGGNVARIGSVAQKEEILPAIAAGKLYAIAMSEPGAGSDVGALSCRAEKVGDRYVINGQKTWISYAHMAEEILLIARTRRTDDKHQGMSMLRVPTDAPGLEIRQIDTLGGRETNDLYFTDCEISAAALVGTEDEAWHELMRGLNEERLVGSSLHLGLARRALEDTLEYVKEREQFGRPIGSFQALSQRIADLATEIECARLLLYDVAARVDADPRRMLPREVAMVKLKTTEVAKQAALEGMQMMGGYGYATEYDMERHLRTALVGTIYGGTSEIQRGIIAKTFGL